MTRARIVEASLWRVRTGSRRSAGQDASTSESPILRSISRNRSTPPSDGRAPPSNRAWISSPSAGDRPGGTAISRDMAGWIFPWRRMDLFGEKFIRRINSVIHTRQPNHASRRIIRANSCFHRANSIRSRHNSKSALHRTGGGSAALTALSGLYSLGLPCRHVRSGLRS